MVSCNQCLYWQKGDDKEMGNCKRFPPQIITYSTGRSPMNNVKEYQHTVEFPSTFGEDYCGEFIDHNIKLKKEENKGE